MQKESTRVVLIHGAEYIRGELYHAARREMITKLDDFLERETKKFTEAEQPKRAEDLNDKVQCLKVIINRVLEKGTVTKPPQKAIAEEIDAILRQLARQLADAVH